MKKRPKKHSVLRRVLSVLGCLLILGCTVAFLIVGLTVQVIAALVIGVAAVSGPAVAGGGGIVDVLADIASGVAEGLVSIAEAIGSLLSF